jgi:serine/threonine protein kinase
MSELKLLQCRLDARYDIEECLGRGSYAEIYVARDRAATDEEFRRVVIKALNVLLQGYQDSELERTLIQNFQNEAIALDRVRHPNIISRLGHGTALDLNGTAFHYIVLEYLSGGDLAALARRQSLEFERALFYLQQVCSGLAHAHESGVIHRDIKPQNLLLTSDQETVKIADFGVAKIEAAEGVITRVGTNIYAPPEHSPLLQTSQLGTASLSSERLTPAADIYSLAKTAYTLFCGTSPRHFAHEPITELPPHVANRHWAAGVLEVLEQATQTRPGSRYQSVQDFWDDLSATVELEPEAEMEADEAEVLPVPTSITSDLTLPPSVVTVAAPPKPRFETSKELQREQLSNGARPRIVVPIAGSNTTADAKIVSTRPGRRVAVSVPVAHKNVAAPAGVGKSNRLRALLVSLILILAFAGMLLATRSYIRKRWAQQTIEQSTLIGREAVTTTDLNLRAGPSSTTDRVGLAESGSRVKVLTLGTNANWCEIQVTQHARAKSDPTSQDRGWVNKQFLKFD